ncbi:marine proteobacterial sortase target protein [uncultured Cohaesibacter sp.]|uniref:marine proteobacterial sortase target protein n=1 Tax=uncultured Cohaesibacter sp. TaxID=1002546 RepID=UPI00292DC9F3|nr:marine proteobacterial sortase target protein [uncultured Cohaesibacter sp.]
MPLPKTHSSRRGHKRHSIELRPKSNHEKSVSKAFKLWLGAYALILGVALSIANSPAQSAQTTAPEIKVEQQDPLRLVTPNDMQSGSLLFNSKEPGRFIEAPKVNTDFKIDITGPVARVIVTQEFFNPSDAWAEGVYVFPLPDNSAVDQLKMKIGDRIIEGKIKRKQEAREIYEKAKEEGKKASLLEQNRPNIFTNSVANIGPKDSITIQIEYQQTIPRKENEFSLRVPLVVAPRYNPLDKPLRPVIDIQTNQTQSTSGWSSTDPVPDRDAITSPILDPEKDGKSNPVTLSINLKAGFPLKNIISHYHEVAIKPDGEDKMSLTLRDETVPADKDFLLTWTGKAGKTPNLGLFTQSKHTPDDPAVSDKANVGPDEDYLLAYITPPFKLTETLMTPPREVVFVIDQSGSMAGPSIGQAKASLLEALGQLKPEDKFQIIRFNNQMSKLFDAPQQADSEHVSTAKYWVAAIDANGGTEMLPAMEEALKDSNPNEPTLRQVIFLTDGAIGNERQLFEAVKSKKGRSRIFTVGIGSAPNSFFMSRAAEVGRGTFTEIGDIGEVKDKMGKLFTQLTTPVATNLEIELPEGKDIEASPSELPDLYLGEPVILALKAKDLGSKLTLKGRFDNQPWSMDVDISQAAPSSAIDKLWARGKIRQLENDRLLSSDMVGIDKAIEDLGLKHHLVTRLTSLVAVDVTPSRPEDEDLNSQKVPLNLPDGWDMNKIDGSVDPNATSAALTAPAPLGATRSFGKKLARFALAPEAMLAMDTSAVPTESISSVASAPTGGQQIKLPKTATWSELITYAGLFFLALAGSLALWLKWHKPQTKG